MTDFKFGPNDPNAISLNGVTAAGAGTRIAMHNARQFSWLVEGVGTVTTGTVFIEAADTQDYSGTWARLDTVDMATAGPGGSVMTNALYIANYPNPFGGFVRGRVDTGGIGGGGNVIVRFNGLLH